jgi:serine/threonine/tyrosine-interacting protein
MRRECQEIIPNLYLGPFVASKSLETLQGLQITHMLRNSLLAWLTMIGPNIAFWLAFSVCIRDAKEAFSVRPRFLEHFAYLVLDVQDNEEQNLIRLFPGQVHPLSFIWSAKRAARRAKAFIDSAISQGGRVLVHCNGACPYLKTPQSPIKSRY